MSGDPYPLPCERCGDTRRETVALHLGDGMWQARKGRCRICEVAPVNVRKATDEAWLKWDRERGWIEWDWLRDRADNAGNRSAA